MVRDLEIEDRRMRSVRLFAVSVSVRKISDGCVTRAKQGEIGDGAAAGLVLGFLQKTSWSIPTSGVSLNTIMTMLVLARIGKKNLDTHSS